MSDGVLFAVAYRESRLGFRGSLWFQLFAITSVLIAAAGLLWMLLSGIFAGGNVEVSPDREVTAVGLLVTLVLLLTSSIAILWCYAPGSKATVKLRVRRARRNKPASFIRSVDRSRLPLELAKMWAIASSAYTVSLMILLAFLPSGLAAALLGGVCSTSFCWAGWQVAMRFRTHKANVWKNGSKWEYLGGLIFAANFPMLLFSLKSFSRLTDERALGILSATRPHRLDLNTHLECRIGGLAARCRSPGDRGGKYARRLVGQTRRSFVELPAAIARGSASRVTREARGRDGGDGRDCFNTIEELQSATVRKPYPC